MVPILTVKPPLNPFEAATSWSSIITFITTFTVGLLTLIRLWWLNGRDQWYGDKALAEGDTATMPVGAKEVVVAEFDPPAKLRPAEIGTLVDEQADTLDVTATIVDLAVRGYLTITEEPKKWLFGQVDYLLARKKAADSQLLNYEKELLSALFSGKEEVRLSELKNTFYDDLAKIKTSLYTEVTKKQLFASNPETVRSGYILVSILGFIGGIVATILGFSNTIPILIGFGFALTLLGITLIFVTRAMPARTAKGRHLYRQALGYKLFIMTAEKYRAQFAERENLFTEVLPYAIVFGATEKLAKAMKNMGLKPTAPTWYHGIHPFQPVVFASDINQLSSTLSTAIASAPSSSGSGGGGFSGGGFGGGGGGSW